jgi:pimeloyl-ACP methyl ester carboxylesterase
LQHRQVRLNGIDAHIAEQGEGPLVLLLHGWPETWFCRRHQIDAPAAAGYRVVAPDQRGYGDTDRPASVDQYSTFHLVGDIVALIQELGEEQAIIVGHDCGSMVAANTALPRPDVMRALACVSIPPLPRGAQPPADRHQAALRRGLLPELLSALQTLALGAPWVGLAAA